MREASFIILVLVMWLATCQAPEPDTQTPEITPTQTSIPATATAVPPTPTETAAPQPKLPAAPFPAKLYVSETGGFALDYPEAWTVNEMVVGDRGTQIQFLSSPDLADAAAVPAGETRLTATIYRWDPKNDLAAYVDTRKTAWSNSGFTILEEHTLTLELGLRAEQFTILSPDAQTVYLITALDDRYLVLAGEGDIDLIKQIIGRVRPITP